MIIEVFLFFFIYVYIFVDCIFYFKFYEYFIFLFNNVEFFIINYEIREDIVNFNRYFL